MIGASAVPKLTSIRAGRVISPAITVTNMTAFAGTLVAVTFDHSLEPGIAPSRLNANVIREALVRQATVQNSWPHAEIAITIVCQDFPRDCPRMTSDP